MALSGGASVALIVGGFAAAGTAPADDAPLAQVVSFYTRYAAAQKASGALLSLGAILFLVFSVGLIGAGRARTERSWPAGLALAGATLLTAGLTIFSALAIAAGRVAGHVEPGALQALHVLNQDMFVPLTVGTSAFLLGAGALALSGGGVPRWLGRSATVLGLLAAVPSHVLGGALFHVGFFAFAGLGLWTLAVSFTLVKHARVG